MRLRGWRRHRRISAGRSSRRLLRRWGPSWWLVAATGALLLGAVVYLGITGLMVRGQVERLQSSLGSVQQMITAGRFDDAQRASAELVPAADRARSLTSGPVWSLAADVPWIGAPLASVQTTTSAVAQLTTSALPTLVAISRDLDPATLHPDGSTIDVATLQRLAPSLHQASVETSDAARQLAGAPDHTWLTVVDSAHASVSSAVSHLAGILSGADQASAIVPRLLGVDGTRRYFVGFQNEAELRGTGGLPGAFAILTATDGKVSFERFESDVALLGYRPDGTVPTGLDFGPAYDAAWKGSDPTSVYVNSNLSANFPYAAQIWASMWEKVSGEHLDGALAVDPTALSYLLAVTGPATMTDGTTVSAATVVDLTQRQAYSRFGSDPAGILARKDWLVQVTQAAEKQLLSGAGSPAEMVKALAHGIGERRILAWSSDPVLESALAGTPAAGIVPDTPTAYSGFVLNNAAAGKLDYYVGRQFDYQRTGCGATRDVQATMTLTNSAPASGLPALVTERLDDAAATSAPGDTRMLVDYVATRGAVLQGITVDGVAVTASQLSEQGHPVYRIDLELPRGTTHTVMLHLTEPAVNDAAPAFLLQPGVTPMPVTAKNQSCR